MQMKDIHEKSKFFKALSDPIRLKIIEYLMSKKKCTCICSLSKTLDRDQSVIFRHIQILINANILNGNKDGKYLLCCVKNKTQIKNLLDI